MPELLPRFSRTLEKLADLEKIRRVLREADAEATTGRVVRRSADGHNHDRRRGVPLITRGVSGTAPGTDPAQELLRKEARGERRA